MREGVNYVLVVNQRLFALPGRSINGCKTLFSLSGKTVIACCEVHLKRQGIGFNGFIKMPMLQFYKAQGAIGVRSSQATRWYYHKNLVYIVLHSLIIRPF